MTPLDERLNTTALATLTGIALAYLCSFLHPILAIIALLSIIPLYFKIQRNHARYDLLDKIWHLDGAWKYVFPFAIYLVMGDLTRAILPGFEEYHIYITLPANHCCRLHPDQIPEPVHGTCQMAARWRLGSHRSAYIYPVGWAGGTLSSLLFRRLPLLSCHL